MHLTDIIQQFNPWLKGASVKNSVSDGVFNADLNVAFVGATARSASKLSKCLIYPLPTILKIIAFNLGDTSTTYAMLSSGIPWNIPCITCIFFVYTRAFRRVCKQGKKQVTSGIFHGIPLESIA